MASLEELERRIAEIEAAVSASAPKIDPAGIYTIAEVAKLLRCGQTNVYQLASAKQLAVIQLGAGTKGFRVRGSDLLAFLDSRKVGGPEPRQQFRHLRI
jgi:excisionase family DNA binding protein